MITCVITDRHVLRGESLLDAIARNLRQGVTWIQIREKDLPARELYDLVRAARALPNPHRSKLLVNTRVDVALAAGADGVHLPSDSPEAQLWQRIVPPGFLFGASCHSREEAQRAAAGGASYILYGPVFAPLSKQSSLPPRGLASLADVVSAVKIPVLALGGITQTNATECVRAGAAGIAGISLGTLPFLPSPSSC